MQKGLKKSNDTLEEFLVKLREHVGQDVIVSLSITKDKIVFESCVTRRRLELMQGDDEGEDSSHPSTPSSISAGLKDKLSYVG